MGVAHDVRHCLTEREREYGFFIRGKVLRGASALRTEHQGAPSCPQRPPSRLNLCCKPASAIAGDGFAYFSKRSASEPLDIGDLCSGTSGGVGILLEQSSC